MYTWNIVLLAGTLTNLLLLIAPSLHPSINTRGSTDMSMCLQSNMENLRIRMAGLEKNNRQLISENMQMQRDIIGQTKENESLRLQLQSATRERNYLQKKLEDSNSYVKRYELIARDTTENLDQ